MLGCQCLCRTIVLSKLGLHQLHFGTKDFEGLIDFAQCLFEFLFALQTNFEAEGICHRLRTPFLRCRPG